MPAIDFAFDHSYEAGTEVHVPFVAVRLFSIDGLPLAQRAILDTGASLSIFDKAVAPLLGVDSIESGDPRLVATAAQSSDDTTETYAYLHPVLIEFLGHRMTIPIGFVPDWPEGLDNLLGMYGFFEGLEVAFLHRERRVLVNFL